MFTRRHYEAVAKTLQEYFAAQDYATETHGPRPSLEAFFAVMFEDDNPNFSASRFYEACEPVE
jgi:hypothetical protein